MALAFLAAHDGVSMTTEIPVPENQRANVMNASERRGLVAREAVVGARSWRWRLTAAGWRMAAALEKAGA